MQTDDLPRLALKEAGENVTNIINSKLDIILKNGKYTKDYKKSDDINIHIIIKKIDKNNLHVTKQYKKSLHCRNPEGIPAPDKHFVVVLK